jgi:hypothetical protein
MEAIFQCNGAELKLHQVDGIWAITKKDRYPLRTAHFPGKRSEENAKLEYLLEVRAILHRDPVQA